MQRRDIFAAIHDERERQDAIHGPQHWPISPTGDKWERLFSESESIAKMHCDRRQAQGDISWYHILYEEFCEVFNAKSREEQITELIQMIAVGVHMVEQLVEIHK